MATPILHASWKATTGLAIMVIKGGDDLTTGVTGLPGFIIGVILNLGLFAYVHFWYKKPIK